MISQLYSAILLHFLLWWTTFSSFINPTLILPVFQFCSLKFNFLSFYNVPVCHPLKQCKMPCPWVLPFCSLKPSHVKGAMRGAVAESPDTYYLKGHWFSPRPRELGQVRVMYRKRLSCTYSRTVPPCVLVIQRNPASWCWWCHRFCSLTLKTPVLVVTGADLRTLWRGYISLSSWPALDKVLCRTVVLKVQPVALNSSGSSHWPLVSFPQQITCLACHLGANFLRPFSNLSLGPGTTVQWMRHLLYA